jgi:general secretion pathway protein D
MRLSWLLLALGAHVAVAAERGSAVAPAPPGAEQFLGCKKYPLEKKFKWSVRGEVGVGELASSLGEISCRPILVASAIAQRGGKVMLDVPDLVTAADVYRLFYGALEAMGLTVDASGGALKIIDAGRGREVASPELDHGGANDDRFVVRLLRPAHATAAELAELLGKMKSKDGDVSVFGAASLVLIDRAVNVRRMEELARALDVGEEGARIYTLETHGQTPTELAGALDKILQAAAHHAPAAAASDKARPAGTAIDGDVRALVPLDNARLVALVGTDAGWQRVRAIAERLDPPADDGAAAKGHVVYLANTNAEDVATTLSSVGLGGRGGGGARPPGPSPSPSPSASTPSSSSPLALTGEVRVGFDKTANALIIYANAADFSSVRELVQKLDVPRRQVYVEAVIFDLSIDKARTLGLSWHGADNNGTDGKSGSLTGFASGQGAGLVSFDAASIAAAASGGGLVAGLLGQSFSLFGKDIPSFGVILQALEHHKDANIISRPHLLTMDNSKATLSVGQVIHVPVQSLGTGAGTTSGAIFSTNYAAQEVALKLELTPHLNDSPSIRLEINGEISDIPDGQSTNQPGGPTTDKRTITTAVVVRDGETVVLGGLTKEADGETVDKIPFLGDIPLLGRLFQTRSKQRVKQDLLIVLTPYIIRGPEDVRRIQQQREEERREFLERFSAFADDKYEAHVDYRRKRGVLEEINVSVLAAGREAEALRAAERALRPRRPDGLIALEPME